MTIAQDAVSSGKAISAAPENGLTAAVCGEIGRFAGWPYKVSSGRITDREGRVAEPSGVVVHVEGDGGAEAIPADRAAAVIEVVETLDIESLRSSYARIAAVKRLKKSPPPDVKGAVVTTVTMGVIFARKSAVPLEALAEELERLNARNPYREWLEMVVVNSVGSLQYGVQFAGEDTITGGMLPPAGGALTKYVPAVYVIMTMMASGDFALNRLLNYLLAHLSLFSPGAKLPMFLEMLEGAPQTAVTLTGYQYNLGGQLVPVPRELYNDRYLPRSPAVIEGPTGEALGAIQYVPWQDGAALVMRGKLPLDGIMIFFRAEILKKIILEVVRRPDDLQLSHVLPISPQDFADMLNQFQQRSNMRIRKSEPNWIVQKLAGEGSASPFMARLFIGILHMRKAVYEDDAARQDFDKKFEFVNQSLMNARDAAREIAGTWSDHSSKIASGEIVRVERKAIHIDQSVDKEMRRLAEAFLNAAVRAMKYGMQELCVELHADIGFLFKKAPAFQAGIAALQATDPLLAAYLVDTRQWSERLIQSRNDVEHTGWALPKIKYERTASGVSAAEPQIAGEPVTQFVQHMTDRLCCFIEDVTMHCLQRRMNAQVTISEIPLAHRAVEAPERFTLTISAGGAPRWSLAPHASSFEDT
jgi:hypothetical protein